MTDINHYGISVENPVLIKDLPETYAYLRALCKIDDGISFNRIGAVESNKYDNLLDKYEFFYKQKHFCYLFVYSYHHQSILQIPDQFKVLNPEADTNIFNNLEDDIRTGDPNDIRVILCSIVRYTLLKNGIVKDSDVKWTDLKAASLAHMIKTKAFPSNFEDVVMNEWYNSHQNDEKISPSEFEDVFTEQFHHIQISKFTPTHIQERNVKLSEAFEQLIETIRRIQIWQDNERVRIQIHTDHLKWRERYSYIKQVTTPFFTMFLGCDELGRYHISYGFDTNFLKIIPDDMASTLLRRIYQFTPGEMEPFVLPLGFDLDCIAMFESYLDQSKNNSIYEIIEVPRTPEKSIEDMLSGLDFD
jgi:hypothetical protein